MPIKSNSRKPVLGLRTLHQTRRERMNSFDPFAGHRSTNRGARTNYAKTPRNSAIKVFGKRRLLQAGARQVLKVEMASGERVVLEEMIKFLEENKNTQMVKEDFIYGVSVRVKKHLGVKDSVVLSFKRSNLTFSTAERALQNLVSHGIIRKGTTRNISLLVPLNRALESIRKLGMPAGMEELSAAIIKFYSDASKSHVPFGTFFRQLPAEFKKKPLELRKDLLNSTSIYGVYKKYLLDRGLIVEEGGGLAARLSGIQKEKHLERSARVNPKSRFFQKNPLKSPLGVKPVSNALRAVRKMRNKFEGYTKLCQTIVQVLEEKELLSREELYVQVFSLIGSSTQDVKRKKKKMLTEPVVWSAYLDLAEKGIIQ